MKGTPPGDALPPPPQRATPARKGARCEAGAGSTRPHQPRPGHAGHGTLAARSGGRAAGGGTAPDTRRPSQRWKAPPRGTPFRHPHSEQRRPARAHAVGPVLGPHARIDRTRDTRVAEPWLHAPEDEWPGEGQRLTPGAPHNGGRHPPRGRPSATPTASSGAGAGSTARIDRARDTRVAEPWLHAPEDERPREGQCLTPGAPHNGGRHPPRGRPSATPTVNNAGPQGRTPWGRYWVHTPTSTAPGTHGSRNPGCALRRTSGQGRYSARHQAPLTTVESTPPGDAIPPPPQRAASARKGARCGTGAGSTRPHRPRPGHSGRGTLAARYEGRARPGEGQRLTPGAPHNGGRHPPRGRPSATPTASNAGPQGRTLWGRCWVHMPAWTAPGTHGSRNPGCTLRRTSGRGRDSA